MFRAIISWYKTLMMAAIPWFRPLVDSVSVRGPGFNSSDVCVGFVVENVAIPHVSL